MFIWGRYTLKVVATPICNSNQDLNRKCIYVKVINRDQSLKDDLFRGKKKNQIVNHPEKL